MPPFPGKGAVGRIQSASRSVTGKLAAIGILVILLLIPKAMVMDLIRERQHREREAKEEVSGKWGGSQTLSGPYLEVPYQILSTVTKDKKESTVIQERRAVFLPDRLDVRAKTQPQIRYRGIFEVVLYEAALTSKASFSKPSFDSFSVKPYKILWDKSRVIYGITDIRGIQKEATLKKAGRALTLSPGTTSNNLASSGVHAELNLSREQKLDFEFSLTLHGAESMRFVPAGRDTVVRVESPWTSPSFQGSFLPKEREVGESGFSALWEVPHLARNFPQRWLNNAYSERSMHDFSFGFDLLQPVNNYSTTTRSAKYGVLFIVLTFLVFFLFEVLSNIRVHAVQYLLIGFALLLFYVLLLALSEQIGFGWAYLSAAAATVGLVTAYSRSVVSGRSQVGTVGTVLAFVYVYLYCLLKVEDYALLLGAVGLFVALAVVMYATRGVNWYEASAAPKAEEKSKKPARR